jgi:hypothetical protein
MLQALQEQFQILKRGPPGKRFQELHARRSNRSKQRTGAVIACGIALIVVGAVLLVIPGPGLPVLLVGCGLIAQELRVIGRVLDSMELAVRRWI